MSVTGKATLKGGRIVSQVTLANGGLTAKIVTLGACLQDLRLEGHQAPLILGFADIADYAENAPYLGAIAGSVANRIGNGAFQIDGTSYELDKNWLGKHTLHGGQAGTASMNWEIASLDANSVTLEVVQPDGHMGFPGNLTTRCTYTLLADATLDIQLSATTDKATYVNLASHCYFNLDGRAQIDQHALEVFASQALAYDADAIPTGDVVDVSGTERDYQTPRGVMSGVLDSNFCLSAAEGLQLAARVTTTTGRQMEVLTDQPGVQVYNAPSFAPPQAGLEGRRYGDYAGLAIEPQNWPDAPNHANFPSALLRPGETYHSHSQFRFA